jgi:hypothetical protein
MALKDNNEPDSSKFTHRIKFFRLDEKRRSTFIGGKEFEAVDTVSLFDLLAEDEDQHKNGDPYPTQEDIDPNGFFDIFGSGFDFFLRFFRYSLGSRTRFRLLGPPRCAEEQTQADHAR